MDKSFTQELNYIKDDKIKENLKIMINKLPDYFFLLPASSTGKYHPSFSLGEGGLLRHTKAAVRIAIELFGDNALNNFTQREKDLIIFSIVLHDGLKSGQKKSEYTLFEHPLLMSNYIKENKKELTLDDSDINFICKCIETHMGPWTTNYKGEDVLPSPKDKYQRFVHMCDYLASRKFLDIKFDKNNNIINE